MAKAGRLSRGNPAKNQIGDLAMSVRFNRAKPFPKLLMTLFLLAVTAVPVYLICVKMPLEEVSSLYESFGKFICTFDTPLIAVILVINVIELIDFTVYAKRDEVIHSNYEYLRGHIGLGTFFKQYFAPLFAKGPYHFASEEKTSSYVRKIFNLLIGVVKYLYWLAVILVPLAMAIKPGFAAVVRGADADYAFTVLVLLACINCNIFLYVLYRCLPLYESRSYYLVTYYTDGTSSTTEHARSNFVAMLLLSAVIYAYESMFYFSAFSNKLVRSVETDRLNRFLRKCDTNQSMLQFYREK